jgi:hypothetical protein
VVKGGEVGRARCAKNLSRVRTFLRTTEPSDPCLFGLACLHSRKAPHHPLQHPSCQHHHLYPPQCHCYSVEIMARFSSILIVLSAWFISSSAQFGFFDQMFGNQGHQQHQEPQNVRSDSSWYQAQYEGGMSQIIIHLLVLLRINDNKPNAHTTSAPVRCPACISHTTVPARGRASKIKPNWAMGLRFVGVKEGGRMGSLEGRWSWRGRVCCER